MTSIIHKSHWFDENGSYVPLSERDISENDIFGQIFQQMEGICDYSPTGRHLHIHTNRDPQNVRSELERRHGGIRATVENRIEKGHKIADGDYIVVIEFKAD